MTFTNLEFRNFEFLRKDTETVVFDELPLTLLPEMRRFASYGFNVNKKGEKPFTVSPQLIITCGIPAELLPKWIDQTFKVIDMNGRKPALEVVIALTEAYQERKETNV
ncbi:hypothetical protein D3C72_1889070 [compost metagenome]